METCNHPLQNVHKYTLKQKRKKKKKGASTCVNQSIILQPESLCHKIATKCFPEILSSCLDYTLVTEAPFILILYSLRDTWRKL